jgi:hypothetical protein
MINKYVSKPLQAHASQWDGANIKEMERLLDKTGYTCAIMRAGNVATLIITKPNDFKAVRCVLGSYLIRHPNGKFDILAEKDFEERYEIVKPSKETKK